MGIRVNFSDTEGGMGIREPLPTGKYHVKVTDGEIKESGPEAKNPGAQYINWEFTIQEGPYADRKVWGITTLLSHALFSLKGLMEAVGMDASGDLDFEIDDLIGKDLIVRVVKKPARTVGDREYDESNEIKGYAPFDGAGAVNAKAGAAAASGSGSLLP